MVHGALVHGALVHGVVLHGRGTRWLAVRIMVVVVVAAVWMPTENAVWMPVELGVKVNVLPCRVSLRFHDRCSRMGMCRTEALAGQNQWNQEYGDDLARHFHIDR
jgi:hypothetical protein